MIDSNDYLKSTWHPYSTHIDEPRLSQGAAELLCLYNKNMEPISSPFSPLWMKHILCTHAAERKLNIYTVLGLQWCLCKHCVDLHSAPVSSSNTASLSLFHLLCFVLFPQIFEFFELRRRSDKYLPLLAKGSIVLLKKVTDERSLRQSC